MTFLLATAMCMAGVSVAAQATQTVPAVARAGESKPTLDRVLGEVTAVDARAGQINLKTTAGKNVVAKFDEKTLCRRMPAGETALEKAIVITPANISVGDKVIARGQMDGDSIIARSLIVVSQGDILQKRQQERAEWMKRGVVGVVTALNPASKEITLSLRSQPGMKPLIITASSNDIKYRRYSPDSVRFSDSVESSFEKLKVGDHLRALGERGADGTHFIPEEIVSGSFRMVGGTVTAVDAQTGEVTIQDIQLQKPFIIVINKDALLRRLTPEILQELEQQAAAKTSSTAPATVEAGGQSARPQGSSVQERIENLPTMTIGDLRKGDGILVSTIVGANPSRATAVILAAGVESYLKKQSKQATRPGFTLDLAIPGAF